MVSQWSLSDSKSPQVSRTLPSILANLNNAVVWMVSTCPLISKLSSLWTNPFVTVLRAPITIGITITFKRSKYNNLCFIKQCDYISYPAHFGRMETNLQKIKKRTSHNIPITHWSYKAYSPFHTETRTTTTVFDMSSA